MYAVMGGAMAHFAYRKNVIAVLIIVSVAALFILSAPRGYDGEFRRLITLPMDTRAEQISSVLDRGLLVITVRGALGSTPTAEPIEVVDRSQEASTPTLRSAE